MRIQSTAVPPDEELEWLLCKSEGAIGIVSNFQPLMDAARGGWGGGGNQEGRITDRKFGFGECDVAKSRRLRTAYMRLSGEHRHVLWLAYGPETWPRETHRPLGQLAGIALLTKAAQDGFKRALKRPGNADKDLGAWIVATCRKGDSEALGAIITEAAGIAAEAVAAWQGPLRQAPRRVRPSRAVWRAPLVMGEAS